MITFRVNLDNPGLSPHFSILNLIISAKSLLYKVTHRSQGLGAVYLEVREWKVEGGGTIQQYKGEHMKN